MPTLPRIQGHDSHVPAFSVVRDRSERCPLYRGGCYFHYSLSNPQSQHYSFIHDYGNYRYPKGSMSTNKLTSVLSSILLVSSLASACLINIRSLRSRVSIQNGTTRAQALLAKMRVTRNEGGTRMFRGDGFERRWYSSDGKPDMGIGAGVEFESLPKWPARERRFGLWGTDGNVFNYKAIQPSFPASRHYAESRAWSMYFERYLDDRFAGWSDIRFSGNLILEILF